MKIKSYKNLMLLILLTFVGQVVSEPMLLCSQSQEASSSAMMDMDDMHSLHSTEAMQMDCCDSQCGCPEAMCLSNVFIASANDVVNYNIHNSYSPRTQNVFIQKLLISTIFHPPILS